MSEVLQLSAFYEAIADDHRLGTSHISLYMALFQQWNKNQFEEPISITREQTMGIAKINGRATYHKCMKELETYGYIRYVPSNNPFLKSIVYFRIGRVKHNETLVSASAT